jgi:tetratricopeptide (TPR) repeat protein
MPGAPGVARADQPSADDGESPAVRQAREHYKTGEAAFKVGDFERARSEFEAGYALVPRPGFLLNMAHSERRLGRLRNARALYKRYLEVDPESKQRDEVLGLIGKLDSAIADEERASGDARAASEPAPSPPPAPPPVPATALAPPAAAAATSSADQDRGPKITISAPAPEQHEPSTAHRPLYRRWWFWGAVTAVAAAAGAGAYFATRGGPTFHNDGSLGRLGGP